MKTKKKKITKGGTKKLSLRDKILKQLNATIFVKPSRVWLDTGSPNCNATWGSRKLGLPAGKLYQFAGKKHAAKTAFVSWLCGLAQRLLGAFVVWIDAENSFDRVHMSRLGMSVGMKETDYANDDFYLIYPKVLRLTKAKKKGKKTKGTDTPFIQGAEYLYAEARKVCDAIKEETPDRPIVFVLDSVAFLRTGAQVEAGEDDTKNMRTSLDRAIFLGDTLPDWLSLAKNYTMWLFYINQIRVNPSVMFGNPEYSPGGSALSHACHVMGGMHRKGGKQVKEGNETIITGYMLNGKNKAGGGSREGEMCSYKIDFRKKHDKGMFRFSKYKKKEKA